MAEKYPLINGCFKTFPNGEPMVVTAWSDSQRGSLLLPEHVWAAALEWAMKGPRSRMIKCLHLEMDRVGVDLFLHDNEDPDCIRHLASAELTGFLAEYIPEHKDCDDPDGTCAACWREEVKARRDLRGRAG